MSHDEETGDLIGGGAAPAIPDDVADAIRTLIRWTGGPAAPDVFIAEAERAGMIVDVTAFVVRTVLREMRVLFDSRPDFCVTINASAPELRDGSLMATLNGCWPAGLPRRHVGVELTERSTVELPEIVPALRQLRELGHPVYIDDFGTGYSSLSHLRRVQVDGLKIDRSFITDLLRDPDDLALTSAIIAMAHSMGITVVAEGVEKQGQFDLLRDRDCDLAQGYWLGQPCSVGEFARLLG